MNKLLQINPKKEIEKICNFIKSTFKKQRFSKVVLGLSGGIDSAVVLSLLAQALPPQNIFPIHLPYFKTDIKILKILIKSLKIPASNFSTINIKKPVDKIVSICHPELLSSFRFDEGRYKLKRKISPESDSVGMTNKTRLGNIMARTRMIILFDQAKKLNALVCGTENKSEHLLGYFTRFGDEASDIEPIQHLYKTQIYQLGKYLNIPQEIINQSPTAGLWDGQTDEGQFGFTYQEADQVLSLYSDQKKSLPTIIKLGFPKTKKIISMVKNNQFKHQTPYFMSQLL